MKKTQLITILSTAALMVLSSCGESSTQPESTSTTVEPTTTETTTTQSLPDDEGGSSDIFTEEVEIVWQSTFSYQDQIETLISDFEEEYPNIQVTYSKLSGSYDTLKNDVISSIGAADLPNVVSCYPDHIAEYLDYGVVVDLSKYMNSDKSYAWTEEDYEDMLPSLMGQCSNFIKKGTYMLPHSSSTEGMFYNEDILGKVYTYVDPNGVTHKVNDGNPVNDEYLNNITWEELLGTLAPAILQYNEAHDNCFMVTTKKDDKGNETPAPSAVVAYSGADNAFVTLCAEKETPFSELDKSTGSGKILFNDNDVMRNTLKEFGGYYRDNLFTTAGIEGETNLNVNEKRYAVFATGSTGGIKYQVPTDASFGTGVMRIPNFEGHPHKVISQGPGLCALKTGTANQQLASYLFMNFLDRADNTLYWALETGYFPVRSSCYETEAYLDACSTDGKTANSLELLKAKTYTYASTVQDDFFTNVAFKGSADARSLAGSLLNTVVGASTPLTDAQILQNFEDTVNAIKTKM